MTQLFKPRITEEAIASVADVLRSGWIGLGPKTAEFEAAFAEVVGANYAVGVNSATAGLHLAMVLAGVGPGDEVITTPITFVSTNHAILYQGATPVFADVQPETGNIDPDCVRVLITKKTRAIVCVHYGGYPCELDALYDLASQHGLALIEDAAHACGSSCYDRPIGSLGTAVFSFHAVKNLPVGDGGMVTVQDEADYKRLKRLRWLGIDKDTYSRTVADAGRYAWEYDVPEVGFKYHMNDISAAIGLAMLKQLPEDNKRRRQIARLYDAGLRHADIIRKPPLSDDTMVTAQHLYAIQARRRNELIAHLKAHDIAPGVHYIPNNTFPMYRGCRGETPCAWELGETLLSLPMHVLLTDAEVGRIIDVITAGW